MEKKYQELVELAIKAREMAYAPYSNFIVGAALLAKSGKIYLGCNIENAAYTPANCAERTAFFKAVSEGEHSFSAIAIVGGRKENENLAVCAPCGVCRQVMMEFCKAEEFLVILGKRQDGVLDFDRYLLEDLLPLGFGAADLIKR